MISFHVLHGLHGTFFSDCLFDCLSFELFSFLDSEAPFNCPEGDIDDEEGQDKSPSFLVGFNCRPCEGLNFIPDSVHPYPRK